MSGVTIYIYTHVGIIITNQFFRFINVIMTILSIDFFCHKSTAQLSAISLQLHTTLTPYYPHSLHTTLTHFILPSLTPYYPHSLHTTLTHSILPSPSIHCQHLPHCVPVNCITRFFQIHKCSKYTSPMPCLMYSSFRTHASQ